MSDIRSEIMTHKLQRSTTRCWSCWQGKGLLPEFTSCRRLAVLINGRLYHRWFCEQCITRLWGEVLPPPYVLRAQQTPKVPLARREPPRPRRAPARPESPFQKGQYIGRVLLQEGIIDTGMLTTHLDLCRQEALCYARYAAPGADPEEVRTIAAGMLSLWASGCEYGREAQ